MGIDLNDPSTWPDDNAALLDLAKTGVVDETAAVSAEPETKDAPVEAPAADAPPPEPPKDAPAAEPVASAEPPSKDPDILAADGKNLIPHAVLRDTRTQLRETKAELDKALAQLDAMKAQPVAPAATPAATPPAAEPEELPVEFQNKLKAIKENWGDDIAEQAERAYRLEQQVLRQQTAIAQLTQVIQSQQQVQQRTEQDTIEDAISASPKMQAWAMASNQEWFDRATNVHATLMKTDRQYAALDWFGRMKALPDRVEALYGPAFEKVAAPDTGAAKEKVKQVMDAPPRSLSDIGGGLPPEKSEFQKLEDMSGAQVTAHLMKLANDPRKFDAYLRSLM